MFLFIPLVSSSIIISEFELNPLGTDSGNEWIELYSDSADEVNLSGWKLVNADNDVIELNGTISGNSFFVILLSGQWLDNSDEKIILINENETIDETPLLSDSSNDNNTWNFCENTEEWLFLESSKEQENLCPEDEEEEQDEEIPEDEEAEVPQDKESIIKIEKYPEEAKFGETLKIEIFIYRGDTSKYAIYAYVENEDNVVSEKTTLHVKSKFTEYEMTIPIQLKANCNDKYENGTYNIILEGLGEKDEEEIEINGIDNSLCVQVKDTGTKEKVVASVNTTKKEDNEANTESSPSITTKAVQTTQETSKSSQALYVANSKIIKNFGFWILILITVILVFVIWKKKLI
ncbi:MAG: lamin tail domain-containing protein [Nanoarchaeota archaeon]|nr:lamin tail domain-containing protein [Nanoarchaeota archaeon]